MRKKHVAFTLHDNGGRRSGIERRRFSYFFHIPERRSGIDRRCGENVKSGDERVVEDITDATDPSRNADRRGLILQ